MIKGYRIFGEDDSHDGPTETTDSIVSLLTDRFSPAIIQRAENPPDPKEIFLGESFACNYGVVDAKLFAAFSGPPGGGYYFIDHLGPRKTVYHITDSDYGGFESQAHKIFHRLDGRFPHFAFVGTLEAALDEFKERRFKIVEKGVAGIMELMRGREKIADAFLLRHKKKLRDL